MPIRNIDGMPGRTHSTGFATYSDLVFVRELRITQEARISALADTRLGIEGHNWLRLLLSNVRDSEWAAMGGAPAALEAEIVRELRFFRTNRITPVFVFSGLAVARKDGRSFAKDDRRPAARHAAWEQYWQGQGEQALRGWGTAAPAPLADLVPFVMQVLRAQGADAMRAPYSSWAQLAYLYHHDAQPIHAIYASLDVLMFSVDRVITAISSTRSTFSWVARDQLAARCGVAPELLLDMCILAGFDWCPTFPALLSDVGFSFQSAVDATRQYGSGFNAIQMAGDARAPSYSDSFLRAYCTVKYHIVLRLDGSVGPLNPDFAPNDLHGIIGYRLPARAYHLLARGVVQPPVLSMLASGSWLEFAPADNGEAPEYRRLVSQWTPTVYRLQCAALCSALGPFFRQRKITLQAWFDPHSETVVHDSRSAAPLPPPMHIAPDALPPDACIDAVLDYCAKTPAAAASPAPAGHRPAEQTAWILRSLGFAGPDGQPTPLGHALAAGLQALPTPQARSALQWPVLVAAVLLGQGLLTGDKWGVAYEDARAPPPGVDPQLLPHIRLVARVATLCPLGPRRGPWRLALNRDLLAFSAAARLVLKTAASCADVACLIAAPSSAPLQDPALPVPLDCAVDDATGLLVHALLVDYARHGPGCGARIKAAAADSIGDAPQALRDAWSVAGAVRAMAKAHGTASGSAVADACAWAAPAFGESA
ncbi:hypothetical protein GGF46_001541 [Coemansia sp. RSA 552]|nr:hypothetical protein GGF46_001541 [Coemansia sp. RSA 552]